MFAVGKSFHGVPDAVHYKSRWVDCWCWGEERGVDTLSKR